MSEEASLHVDRPFLGLRRSRWSWCAVAIVGAALGAGFLGRHSPMLDAFSHFRAHLAVAMALLGAILLARRRFAPGLAALAIGAVAFSTCWSYLDARPAAAASPATGATYTLLQMNVLYKAIDPTEALRRIAEARPDIVTVEEITPAWRETLGLLSQTYPYQFFCDTDDTHGLDVGILSRRPFVEGSNGVCDVENVLATRDVDLNGVGVTIAVHHQQWPWPIMDQWGRLRALSTTLRTLQGPLLLAGDFNAVPWSGLIKQYELETRTRAVHGVGPTWGPIWLPHWFARTVGLPIDQILHSRDIEVRGVERLAATTSDHLPVLLRFGVSSEPGEPPVSFAEAGAPAH